MTEPSKWNIEQLRVHLMAALELELLTIPPYLTALYSLGGKSETAEEIIRSVVMEEMLHLALAANVLNAVGGKPELTTGGYVPRYPAKIPFHEPETFQVSLLPFGQEALTTFLAIENPNHSGVEPPPASAGAAVPRVFELAAENGYKTIGEFYGAIEEAIQALDARRRPLHREPRPADRAGDLPSQTARWAHDRSQRPGDRDGSAGVDRRSGRGRREDAGTG